MNRIAIVVAAFLIVTPSENSLAQSPLVPTGDDHVGHAEIKSLVNNAIAEGQMPGAVVIVANKESVIYAQAFGDRQTLPQPKPMRLDTVFDLASITKPVATATSIMLLVQRGKINVESTVASYLPEFGQHGKGTITVKQLLTHMGGLIPDNHLRDYQDGAEKTWQRICDLKLSSSPGSKFAYTDVGFIVLGEMVKRLSGKRLDVFAKDEIFATLKMQTATFNPAQELRLRAAPTEKRDGKWICGVVHDPRAHLMDGVAGHAGLFATANDLVIYGQMMLGRGTRGDVTVLSEETFSLMTQPRDILRGTRTFGWDHRSPYSRNRGDRFSDTAFGHGGFTGTVLWIDPEKELVFVFLANRLHPDGKGSVNKLAGDIATIIAK